MSRIDRIFEAIAEAKRPGLVTFVTAGDPDAERSAGIVRALGRGGADIIEVGVPFSDPVADGPVIEQAAARALAAGGSLTAALALVGRVRAEVAAGIVLFTYLNPVLRFGLPEFVERAAAVGVDGVLVLDLPLEEAGDLDRRLIATGIDPIHLISPTTTDERIAQAASLGRGFLYAISRLGVTGVRENVSGDAEAIVRRIRRQTSRPVALGFGISRPEHVREVGRYADAAVVGSALVSRIADWAEAPDLESRVEQFVRALNPAGAAGA
jgi:tryptophan synthase alpha chain